METKILKSLEELKNLAIINEEDGNMNDVIIFEIESIINNTKSEIKEADIKKKNFNTIRKKRDTPNGKIFNPIINIEEKKKEEKKEEKPYFDFFGNDLNKLI